MSTTPTPTRPSANRPKTLPPIIQSFVPMSPKGSQRVPPTDLTALPLSLLDLRLTTERDRFSQTQTSPSALSPLTRRANEQMHRMLETLDSPKADNRNSLHQQHRLPKDTADPRQKEAQRNFDKNFQELVHMLDDLKKREHNNREMVDEDDEDRVQRKVQANLSKTSERPPESKSGRAHYLTPTKSSSSMSSNRYSSEETFDVSAKIEKIKSDPQEQEQFKKHIAVILEQERQKRIRIVIHGPTLSYRENLELLKQRRKFKRIQHRQMQIRKEREAVEQEFRELQERRWAWLSVLGSRIQMLRLVIQTSREHRHAFLTATNAARVIQRYWRGYVMRTILKRIRWSKYTLERYLIKYASRTRMRKKIRAANLIYRFLKDNEELSALARTIRRFRFSVGAIQTFWRSQLAIIHAQIELLGCFYIRVETAYLRYIRAQLKEKARKDQTPGKGKKKPAALTASNSAPSSSSALHIASKDLADLPRTSKDMIDEMLSLNYWARRRQFQKVRVILI
eukprot:TRINITY_DN2196_c0_g1_i10.p1 TRINITY_DN2196_c0_g1~~TRINITY_DN2196_c0_g1_i10.p1  ORF type:complete len:510 (-),score=94.72 TRINITY_DN2196_c0_g1_i10:860-2389(-)